MKATLLNQPENQTAVIQLEPDNEGERAVLTLVRSANMMGHVISSSIPGLVIKLIALPDSLPRKNS